MIRSALRSATTGLWDILLRILSGDGPEVAPAVDPDNRGQIDPNG